MEIEDESKKIKIILENLPAIFSKEIEKLMKCLEESRQELNNMNYKIINLVEKLENSIQQYELVFHEAEICKIQYRKVIDTIAEKLLIDIMKIKNPNETLYELMKMFFTILNRTSNNLSWIFLQSHFSNFHNIKKDLEALLEKDIGKEIIDLCMPFNLNYNEIKISLTKINKYLITILDLIKLTVDFNVKKNIVKSLYQSNINKNNKLMNLKNEIQDKEIFINESSECIHIMQSELTQLLTQKNYYQLYLGIISKYDFLNRYKIYIFDDKKPKPRVIIKLKTKYKTRDAFINTMVSCRHKSIEEIQNELNHLNLIYSRDNTPKNNIENISSKSRNVQNNLYTNKTDLNVNKNKGFYTSDRVDKHKSIGSTIFRDVDTIEYLMHNDKLAYNIGQNKPVPRSEMLRSSIYDSNNKIIEEEKLVNNNDKSNYDNHVIREDIYTYRIVENNREPKELEFEKKAIKTERGESDRRKDDKKNNVLKIESKKFEMPRYLCCK